MNIQQAAAVSGLSADTIRFYERKGVLPRPPRQANGYRNYTEEHVATLRLARGLRRLGVPLDAIGPVLEVAHTGVCGDIRGRLVDDLSRVRTDIDAQIAELQDTRNHVTQLLDGLIAMRIDDADVPGTVACRCISMVIAP